MALHIDGPEQGKLSAAVLSAFPTPPALAEVLTHKLNDTIANFAPIYGDYPQTRTNMIQSYNARYQIDKLVLAMLEANPTNELLLEYAWRHGILGRPPGSNGKVIADDNSLERLLEPRRGFSNPMDFLRRFGQIINCVCRISAPIEGGNRVGTGLLIGNETVLTNYHIVEDVIKRHPGADRKNVRLMFDFHLNPDGTTTSKGVEYKLVDNDATWLIASAPYHADDLKSWSITEALASTRPADDLDFALLRVAGMPGAQQIGEKPSPNGAARGHIALPLDAETRFKTDFEMGASAQFIFQHANGKHIQMDWEKPAILGVNGNGTRVLYNINTEPGSSGSPCFNAKLELCALHQAGGKDWPAAANYLYNQGIPVSKIVACLQRENLLTTIE